MNKNNATAWKTKYGPRRVRQEDPTLVEAIAAARDLSDDIDQQVDIAASLIGMPADQVRAELLKLAPPRKDNIKTLVFTGPATAQRVVVVESKRPRRVLAR